MFFLFLITAPLSFQWKISRMRTLSDVGTLLVDCHQNVAGGRVKADGGMVVAYAAYDIADHLVKEV